MKISEFETDIMRVMRDRILKEVKNNSFLNLQYSDRKHLPDGILDKLWDGINWDEVIEQIRPMVQTRICNSIVSNMETELKTDIKSLLCVDGVRQKLRMNVYPELMKVLNEVKL